MRIIDCESDFDPEAVDYLTGRHIGLMQVRGGSTDPVENIRQAFAMWERRGFQPWAASRHCWAR